MACRYIYKGHEFNSEVEFDDFLIERKKFESKFGDLVFSRDGDVLEVHNILKQAQQDAKDLDDKFKQYLRDKNKKKKYGPDGEINYEDPPRIGVNRFLGNIRLEGGKRLFPEFILENYWNEREQKWKVGDFLNEQGILNEAEIDEFGLDKNNLGPIQNDQVGTKPDGSPLYRYEQMEEAMEFRWENQAKIGTAVHNILLIIFLKNDVGEYNFKLDDAALHQLIIDSLEEDNKKYINDKALDSNNTGTVIQDTINYAKKLRDDLVRNLNMDTIDDLDFYPEFSITQTAKNFDKNEMDHLYGIIDLLIVDKNGRTHILDYKTSVHDYANFKTSKKLTYAYQMATYQRMLLKYGINVYEGRLLVAPIQLTNFRKDGDKYSYDKIESPETFMQIDAEFNSNKIFDNIDLFMPVPFKVTVNGSSIGKEVTTFMSQCFPSYSYYRQWDEQSVTDLLKKNKQLEPDENGLFIFKKFEEDGEDIISSDRVTFVKKVQTYLESLPDRRLKFTGRVKNFLKDAIREGGVDNVNFPSASDAHVGRHGDKEWVKNTLGKYTNGAWEVVDNSVLEQYGIIMLKSIDSPNIPALIDFIRVSTNDLSRNYKVYNKRNSDADNLLKNRTGLTGRFESDLAAYSKQDLLMAEAVMGNIEIMEVMAILNQLGGLDDYAIGNVAVVNPIFANGLQMSNEQMNYCFNQLNLHLIKQNMTPIHTNDNLKFSSYFDITMLQIHNIMLEGKDHEWKDEYKDFKVFKSSMPNFLQSINSDLSKEEKIAKLMELKKNLENHDYLKTKIRGTHIKQVDLLSQGVSLYNNILIALAELKGVNFRQQLNDHSKWLESVFLHRDGVSGSYLDNPGNLNSETLNLVTKLVTEAYQNTRDDLKKKRREVSELVEELKRDANFGRIKELTIGNQVNLYKDMIYETADGNIMFVDPNTLTGAKRKFLEYALHEINSKRFRGLDLETLKLDKHGVYYEVPLALGGNDSKVSESGLMDLFTSSFKNLLPANAWKRAKAKAEGVFEKLYDSRNESDDRRKREDLFKMSNMFDAGQGDNRMDVIERYKKNGWVFEKNLETLLLKHMFAYSVQENMDAVFPMIKAAMVHITQEGAMRNMPFENDLDYLEDYIKNKIHNTTIVDPKLEKFAKVAGVLKSAASKMTLAFAPVQMFYQPLQGLWQNISLMIRKPDGKESFTFQHFLKAHKLVYRDFFDYSGKPTLFSLLNEQYALNDMDMNTYVDRISTAKKGIWNFENLMFKFASRPDYYNRSLIFACQMMGDGSLEAHSINKDGLLVYDYKLDKRYAAYANNDKSNMEEYNKARALYRAAAEQFIIEHAKNPDGTVFKIGDPLPRAYTNKEAEAYKSLSDDIYGYYSHEKKSLIMATTLGSMWLQFKTFWSGKKNQYLGSGGVKLRGQWKHYSENGVYYYYEVDDQGNIDYTKTTTKETIAPVYRWEGQWQEGIMVTLSDLVRSMYDHTKENGLIKGIKEGFHEKWDSDDPQLRLVYRSNMKQILYDLLVWGIGGALLGGLLTKELRELLADNKENRDFITGLMLTAANVGVMTVKNSFLDLNFVDSIGSPIGQWTPFAFDWGQRTWKNWWNVLMGDEDFWDGVVKTSGGLKQIKPVLDSFKPDIFRTEREGGTFGVK